MSGIEGSICSPVLVIYDHITNFHKRSSFKQLTLFSHSVCGLRVSAPGVSGSRRLSSRCQPGLRSHLQLDCRRRLHFQAHVVVDGIQFLEDCWIEGLGSRWAISQRSPSVPCHVDLSAWSLTSSKPAWRGSIESLIVRWVFQSRVM